MRSINLTNLYMEENDTAFKEEVRCNHGFVLPMKTSWTSRNPDRKYWACPYYRGPRSCDFYCWRDKESIDPRSKFVIPKLIEKIGELEHLVESYDKLVEEASEEVNKPKASNQCDNCIETQLEKLEGEIEKMKEREMKWKSKMVKQRTRENVLLFVLFCCCVVAIANWFGVIYMKKRSMKLS
ncbi:hypothetical protein RND71_035833 [Anisodus tanguticus]|uniref:Zinc finger GRF-type domain-containing protein n=1 Tax=Anisodus tanguticus TaxID=243964 RepID=A0AAE1R7N0_9SOLA|nr:hypothetical protein RND71_035833 [Anisodus tanguticus]